MILTYEKIREIKQKEKGEKLQQLPPNFYENAFNYIKLKKGTIEEKSAKNLVYSIFELRKKKILNLAFLFYKTNNMPKKLEDLEKELYLELIKIIRKYDHSFEQNYINKETKLEEERKNTKVKVVFLKDIPEILSPSGRVYSFKKGEETELEPDFTKILYEAGFCKIIL